METVGHDAGDDFSSDAAPRETFADAEESTGAGDGGEDGVGIDGFDAAQVDDFDLVAILLEFVGSTDGFVHHGRVGDDGGVPTRAGDARFADGQRGVGKAVGFEVIVEELVLAEDDGVIEVDGGEEHVIGVLDGGGGEDDQAGVVGVDAFHALAVERTGAGGAATGQADDDGAGNVGAPELGGGLVDDLVETDAAEVGKLHLDDGSRAFDGGSDGGADHGIFADGRINDATGEFAVEMFGGFEGTTEFADVLTVDEDSGITPQGFVLGFANGFEIS